MAHDITTSIKIKKFWCGNVAADGGAGLNLRELQSGQREGTVQFTGADADTTNYKNILGNILESDMKKGDRTLTFQLADLTPEILAELTGGTYTSTADADTYTPPENENVIIERTLMFLTGNNILVKIPRAVLDAQPNFNDDDLHNFQFNAVLVTPNKDGESIMYIHDLKLPDANDITSFVLAEQTGAATINDTAHTVSIEVANGTVVTALEPSIGVSLGASIDPISGDAQDFTSPVEYTVESANGDSQVWTVTVTVAV